MQKKMPPAGVIWGDEAKCHGCGICELVCSLAHHDACGPSLSRIRIIRKPLEGEVQIQTCHQCVYPNCYYACPIDAIIIDERTGARVITPACRQCHSCADACPYNQDAHVIRRTHDGMYIKCDLCYTQAHPLCVSACPWGALRYLSKTERNRG